MSEISEPMHDCQKLLGFSYIFQEMNTLVVTLNAAPQSDPGTKVASPCLSNLVVN